MPRQRLWMRRPTPQPLRTIPAGTVLTRIGPRDPNTSKAGQQSERTLKHDVVVQDAAYGTNGVVTLDGWDWVIE